jgi:hemoglobin/transferrin/lactoferrin receptor protein
VNYTHGEQRIPTIGMEPADRIPAINGRIELSYDSAAVWRYEAWANFSGQQDRLSARDIRDVRIDPNGTAGWGVFGMRAVLERPGGWQISVTVDNLLDKLYRRHGSGIDSIGRNLSIGIRKRWP